MLITHLIIAISSLIVTGLALFKPSKNYINISRALVGFTLLSGTILVVQTHAPLLSACQTGLIYLAISLIGIKIASKRLSTLESTD